MTAFGPVSPLALALAGGGALLLACVIAGVGLYGRRRDRRDLREIVAAIEELRSDRPRGRTELRPGSKYEPVADSVNRLGHDIAARWSAAVVADEGLRAMLEAARDYAIVAVDADWDIRSASPGAAAMFALEVDALVGLPVSTLFEEDSWNEILPRLVRRGQRERGVDGRFTLVRREGSRFPARVAVRQRSGGNGYLIVLHDVSAEVRLEDDLRASEARYRRLVEGLPNAVAVVRDGLVVYGNPAFAALLGLGAPEAAGLRLRERVETADVLVLQDALDRLGAAREGERAELRLRLTGAREGAGPAVRVALTAVRHEGAPALLATFRDETAERRVDAELRRNESRMDALVEAAAEGLVVLADAPLGSVVTMTNAAFSRLTGLDREHVLGAVEPDLRALLRARGEGGARIAELLASGASATTTATVEIEGADGPRTLEVALGPMRGLAGRSEGRVLVLRDLSAARSAESSLLSSADELRRAKDELEAAYRELQSERDDVTRRQDELEKLNGELRSLDAMKSDLLANVSHELQTPLVSIRGYTEMILKERLGPVNDEQRKGLALALRNIDRLIALIDNLLSFSRVDRGTGELNLSVFPVLPVVDEAVAVLKDRLQARRIAVPRSYEDPQVAIRADRDKIFQVFLNLLSNAVKFNRDDGRIEIVVRAGKPGFVLVQIHDTGVGIPEQDLEKVFDRFYRVESPETSQREGSGIGLAIVRGILRQHGCVIQASSRVGHGTTFTFTLPLAEASPAPDPRAARTSRPAPAASPAPAALPPAAPVPAAPAPPAAPARAPETADPARPRLRIIRKP